MPKFTSEQQTVIDKIDEEQANGVEEPLLLSQDEQEYRFSFKRLSAYLRNLLLEYRNTVGQQIQMIHSGEVMGSIPPGLAAAINRQFAPERQAAVATYQAKTSALLQENGLFNADPAIRNMQENLLFGQGITSQMTPDSLNLSPEQSSEANFIAKHLQERFDAANKNADQQDRPPVKAYVEKQFLAVGIALAMGDKTLDDVRDKNGQQNGGAVLDQLTENLLQRARVTTEKVHTPQQALSQISNSVQQYNAKQQVIHNESSRNMQGLLRQEFRDQHDQNKYNLISNNPEIAKLQNDLMAGKVKPNNIDFEKFGAGVLAEAAAKDHSQRTRHLPLERKDDNPRTPGLILKAEAVGLMDELNERLNQMYPGIDPRSMAIKEDVKQQIPSVALALALSPKEEAGQDVQDAFLKQMHDTSEAKYTATQGCLRSVPSDTAALTQTHTKGGEVLSVATQTHTVVNEALTDMGVAPEPVPTPASTASRTMSPRPN